MLVEVRIDRLIPHINSLVEVGILLLTDMTCSEVKIMPACNQLLIKDLMERFGQLSILTC